MKKLILIVCLLLAACQPTMPQEVPAIIGGIEMQIGDELRVTCPGALSYTGDFLRCTPGIELPTLTPTVAATATITPTKRQER